MKRLLFPFLFLPFWAMALDVPPDKATAEYDGKKVLEIAANEEGVFKIPGQDNKRVKQYVTETYNDTQIYTQDGWCSGFAAWSEKQAGNKYSADNTDYAWMFVAHKVEQPKPGDIAMLDSHIAFFVEKKVNGEGKTVVGILGGNQDSTVNIFWVPEEDIEYYAEPDPAPPGWMPTKHLANGMTGHINVLDDHVKSDSSRYQHSTRSGAPL